MTSETNAKQSNNERALPQPSPRTLFRQQQLPAWQPVLTAGTVLPTFFALGIAFIPLGFILLNLSASVHEYIVDYTLCNSSTDGASCSQWNSTDTSPCVCELQFTITASIPAPVYFYYGLSNFYQNHRRYVKSRSDDQLMGASTSELGGVGGSSSQLQDCVPYATDAHGKIVAPCGAIANSLFNDSFRLSFDASRLSVPFLRTGIAWPSDKYRKFQNPEGELTDGGAFNGTVAPLNWPRPVWQLDPDNAANNGYKNEDLIVWLRTAALPTFRKLWARLNTSADSFYATGLPNGTYRLRVEYNYPVVAFGGEKRFIISNTSLIGGKNTFMGVAYIVVGGMCILIGLVLLFVHLRYGRHGSQVLSSNSPWSERY